MVKRLQLGETIRPIDRPLIAVSMQVKDEQALNAYFNDKTYLQADVLEWRIDAWQDLSTLNETVIAKTISSSLRPVIFTWRTKAEGGLQEFDLSAYLRVYDLAIQHGIAAVDIEIALLQQVSELINIAHTHGVNIIGSRHDWTFPIHVNERVNDMIHYPVDVVKYVAMAETQAQAQNILQALDAAQQKTDQPLIVMAMGDAGSFTRLEGFDHGSQLTFAQIGIASAPGQLAVQNVLDYFST